MTQQQVPSEIVVEYEGGQKKTFTSHDFYSMLMEGPLPKEITLSVKEGRQRVKYVGSDRFISAQLDVSHLTEMVKRIPDRTQYRAARAWFYQAIQKNIFECEEWLHTMVEMEFGKSNIQQFLRDPKNPWVRAGWNIQEGMKLAGITQGGGEG